MDKLFQVLAAVLVGVAIFFWYKGNSDWTFAAVVCAIASFFISMRIQMKERVTRADAEEANARGNEDDLPEDNR